MLCQRCSHPLPPLADRCLRCFALNPRAPGAPLSIASDPPAPAAPELVDTQGPIEWQDAAADPLTAATDRFPVPAAAGPMWTPRPQPNEENPTSAQARVTRPAPSAQLLAWTVDLAAVLACGALHVAVAMALLHGPARSADYCLDLLLRGPRLPALWAALWALLAIAYSWLFTALGGRTPGLALAGLRLESKRGGTLTVGEALARSALAVPSAALGLAGFALALVDPRGQTLHDKLCGSIVVRG